MDFRSVSAAISLSGRTFSVITAACAVHQCRHRATWDLMAYFTTGAGYRAYFTIPAYARPTLLLGAAELPLPLLGGCSPSLIIIKHTNYQPAQAAASQKIKWTQASLLRVFSQQYSGYVASITQSI